MKKIRVFLIALLALTILFSVGAAAADVSFKGKSVEPVEPVEIVISHQVDPAIIATENATEIYLPASCGYRVPEDTNVAENEASLGFSIPGVQVIVSEAVDPEVIAAENATEVYLDPVKIDENTYAYYDEDGVLFGTFVVDPDAANTVAKAATTVYYFNWSIQANSYTHGDIALDTVSAVAEIHHSVLWLGGTLSYAGFYTPRVNQYAWINPPSTSRLEGYFLVGSSDKVNFALKNAGSQPSNYTGSYWVEY